MILFFFTIMSHSLSGKIDTSHISAQRTEKKKFHQANVNLQFYGSIFI